MPRLLALAFVGLFSAHVFAAIDPFVIKDIRVEGLQRISAGTVFNYLPVKVGETLTEDKAQEAIRALFKTGFFSDVRIERQDNVLVVHVKERPSIDSIKITGVKEIEDEELKKSLRGVGLAEGRVFNSAVLDRVEQELKRQYFSRGYYAVSVKPTVTPLERNRVAIEIAVAEGPIAKIGEINIVGNKRFTDKELRKQFTLSPPTLFSFFTKKDQYSRQKLASDLEGLRSFYQNQGYLEFNIESTQVSISPDKRWIYVTVNIQEGEKYTVSGYKVAGKLPVEEEALRKQITVQPGSAFSRQAVTESTSNIVERLGNDGFAFANVNVVPDIDKEKRQVALTFFVDPGQRVYVRRISFFGNVVTRDEVLRRELRQFEGAWYSAEKIKRSVARLRRLGFFEEVTVDTAPVPGSPDQVDVNVTVKETNTGSVLAGVGYSDIEGVILNASVSLKNLLGTGKELSASVDTSQANRNFNLTYVNPYYTLDGISRGFNLYSSGVNAAQARTAAYNSQTYGGSVFFGIPIAEERTVNLGLGYESVQLEVNPSTAQVAQDFVARYGDTNAAFRGTLAWTYDTLDNPLFPREGVLHRASAEVALPGGDLEYYRLNFLAMLYYPISPRLTWRARGEVGYGDGYGDTEALPFYKNFYAGGASTVRGFRGRSLGPRDALYTDDPIGGSKRVLANTEIQFPVPGVTDGKSMRLSLFLDAGMVYGPNEDVDLGEVRYSTGLAFNWFSPIAPLSLSFGVPLNAQEGDKIERIQFTLGTFFR